ncbi:MULTISPECIES: sulfatase [unclassified Carboxylicivirga]|uniref:sulfatase n=1 Tax=Carboxylicivirga TaxID=1628153 RepID=UPI003D325EF6
MKYGVIIALFVLLTSCKEKKQTNVILFLVDDLGWTDLACYGSDLHQTPNIDKLASKGYLFTNSYSSCNVCSPTRASIMTGKSPARLHITDWIEGHKYPWAKLSVPDWNMKLDTNEYTMAEAFKSAGYKTAHFGKWHLGETEEYWPENHGFDINVGGWSKGAPRWDTQLGYNGYFSPFGNPHIKDEQEDEYLTEYLSKRVCDYIKEQKSSKQPFFINFWLYNVHTPLQAKAEKVAKYQELISDNAHHTNATYAAMVEHTDDAMGAILKALKDANLDENTIILFSSDNGGLIGKGKHKVSNNAPLREGKGTMYEGGTRIPTVLYLPNTLDSTKVISTPVISMDYLPTLAALTNVPLKNPLDGVDWSPLLRDESINREALYWHYPHYHQQGAVPHSIIRKGDWKLIQNFETEEYEFYNLKDDLSESNNLINSHSNLANDLLADLKKWQEEVDAQYPTKNENFNPKKRWLKH